MTKDDFNQFIFDSLKEIPKANREEAAEQERDPIDFEFTKFDEDKPRVDLLPKDTLLEIAEVITHGANKYGDNNWKECKPEEMHRYTAALYRHMFAFEMGHERDWDSGLRHLAHAATNILFLMHLTGEDK